MTRISLCMIVRDEAENLERCLRSVRGVVDEICVLDTGSGDGTPEIARGLGARVETTAWGDDFGAARNASLAMAGGDWILVLDADEELATEDARERLEAFAREHPDGAGQVVRHEFTEEDGVTCESARTAVTRFFPAGREPRFQGCIHEQLTLEGQEPPRFDTGVTLRHYGYAPGPMERKAKIERNLRLLRKALIAEPTAAYLWWHLGRTLARAGQHEEAMAAFGSAAEHVDPEAYYNAHLLECIAYSLRALDRSEEALRFLEPFEESLTERADSCFLLALLAMDLGQFERAERGFEHCLTMAGETPGGGPHSPSSATYAPAHNLGVMREVLGDPEAARRHYARALELLPEHAPSREGLERVEAALRVVAQAS